MQCLLNPNQWMNLPDLISSRFAIANHSNREVILEPTPKFQSKSNDSPYVLAVIIFNKHSNVAYHLNQIIHKLHQNPNLNQWIRTPRSEVLIRIKRFANLPRMSDLNQMICALRSVVPIWIMICDMRSPDQSFDLNRIFGAGSQIISELNDSWSRSKVPI